MSEEYSPLESFEDVKRRYPDLKITDGGETTFRRIFEVLPDHPKADEVLQSLDEQLKYLHEYGCTNELGKRRFIIELRGDLAPLSFLVTWYLRDQEGYYQPKFYGGMQCNAVRQKFGSVVVGEPRWWSIHT